MHIGICKYNISMFLCVYALKFNSIYSLMKDYNHYAAHKQRRKQLQWRRAAQVKWPGAAPSE